MAVLSGQDTPGDGVSTALACTAPAPYRASSASRARSASTTTSSVTALADSRIPEEASVV